MIYFNTFTVLKLSVSYMVLKSGVVERNHYIPFLQDFVQHQGMWMSSNNLHLTDFTHSCKPLSKDLGKYKAHVYCMNTPFLVIS